jgi:phage FluMu protein Com/uncharacterized membrane protein
MPIEFRCHQCNKLLRVGDETAGKQAKCPNCGTVQQIPAASPAPTEGGVQPPAPRGDITGNPFALAPPGPAQPFDAEQNPYRSPSELQGPPSHYGAGRVDPERAFQPSRIDAGDILTRTWVIFKTQWAMCSVAFFLTWIIEFGFGMAIGPLSVLSLQMAGIGQNDPTGQIAAQFLTQLAGFLLGTYLQTGLAMFLLNVARGGAPNISDLFAGGRYYPAMLPARFLFFLMYFLGLAACIVPGIMLALMFCQYYFIIIDREEGAIDSLRLSSQITSGNKGALFTLGLSMFGIALLGLLALCMGVFVATAFNYLMLAVAYLAMTGQRTADQLLTQPAYR